MGSKLQPWQVLQYVDSNLFAAHQYSFTVAAVSTQGKPGAPSGLRVTLSSGKGVTLEWAPPEDWTLLETRRESLAKRNMRSLDLFMKNDHGGAPVTAYVVERDGEVVATLLHAEKMTWTELRQKVLKDREAECSKASSQPQAAAPPEEDRDILLNIPEEHVLDELNMSEAAGPVDTIAVDELEALVRAKLLRRQALHRVAGTWRKELQGTFLLTHGHLDPVALPPQEPTGLSAEEQKLQAIDGSRVRLSWEPPPLGDGEAPVKSYRVYRNGRVIGTTGETASGSPAQHLVQLKENAEDAKTNHALNRQDVAGPLSEAVNVKTKLPGLPSAPRPTAFGLEKDDLGNLGPERASQLKKGGVVQRCGSQFLDNVLADVVGPASEPAQACQAAPVRAVAFLDPPKMGDRRWLDAGGEKQLEQRSLGASLGASLGDVVAAQAESWYNVLMGLLPELRSAGINMVWHGPRRDVDQNVELNFENISTGFSPAVPGGSGAHTTGEPAACATAGATGDVEYAPSVDHSNSRIQADVKEYIKYLMDEASNFSNFHGALPSCVLCMVQKLCCFFMATFLKPKETAAPKSAAKSDSICRRNSAQIGFRALRFDFVKGYAPRFQAVLSSARHVIVTARHVEAARNTFELRGLLTLWQKIGTAIPMGDLEGRRKGIEEKEEKRRRKGGEKEEP
eukprot:Skav203059  [mRNA]  locus=scaffold4669:56615:69591:- [translate_table: standard]